MRRECYRCRRRLLPDAPDPEPWDRARDGEPVSHGLCAECLEKELQRLDGEANDDPGTPGTW